VQEPADSSPSKSPFATALSVAAATGNRISNRADVFFNAISPQEIMSPFWEVGIFAISIFDI
jgi:hypothetical protein